MSPTYDRPDGSYTSSIPPGVAAFRAEIASLFGFTRTEVVRDHSRCQQQRSEHCEARAVDLFTTDLSDEGKGRQLFEFCIWAADRLGIQSAIFNRRVWGFGTWHDERDYDGPSPHTDHAHIGMNHWGAANVTRQRVRQAVQEWRGEWEPEQDEEDDMQRPVVGIWAHPTKRGSYWVVGRDGGVFAAGGAGFYGNAIEHATSPIVDFAPTPTGRGYYLISQDGGVYAYGDAVYAGRVVVRDEQLHWRPA